VHGSIKVLFWTVSAIQPDSGAASGGILGDILVITQ